MEYYTIEGQRKSSNGQETKNYVVDEYLMRVAIAARPKSQSLKCVKYNPRRDDHCGARGVLDFATDLVRMTIPHTCERPNIQKHQLKRRLYDQAESVDSYGGTTNIRDIFDEECRRVDRNIAVDITFKKVQSNMGKRKARAFPKVPENLTEMAQGLEERLDTLGQKYKGNLEFEGQVFAIIFGDEYLMQNVPEKSQLTSWDGTFRVAPKTISYQLFSIMGVIDHHSFPILTILMDGKTELKYKKVFEKLHELCPNLDIREAMSDFERASRNACESVYQSATVHHCGFHFSQANFKRILVGGLVKLYNEHKEFNKWCRQLMAVDLLPHDCITVMMHELLVVEFQGLSESNTTLVNNYKRYFRRQWLPFDKENLSVFGMDSATNNGCESFHALLGRKFTGKKPSAWNFVTKISDVLQDKSIELERLILHGPGSITRDRRKKVAQNLERRRAAEYELEIGQITPKQFLERVSHTFDTQVADLQRRFRNHPEDPEFEIDDQEEPEPNGNNQNIGNQMANNNEGAAPTCAICLGPRGDRIRILVDCGHLGFCAPCIDRSLQIKKECPVCKKKITKVINGYE